MLKANTGRRKASGAALVFCQLVFVLPAVFPGVLLCHRSDGRAVVETATPFGCNCRECEQCLERRAEHAEPSSHPSFLPYHCQHEATSAGPDASSELAPERSTFIPPALSVAAAQVPGLPGPPARVLENLPAWRFPAGGAGPSPIRC